LIIGRFIEYDGYLWVSQCRDIPDRFGHQSIERIPLPTDSEIMGKVAVDFDYLWLGTGTTLFRFDKLGREWMEFDLPDRADPLVGLWTNGTDVCGLGHEKLFRFTAGTEKWNVYPIDKRLIDAVVFYPGVNTFKVLDGKTVPSINESFTWVTPILDNARRCFR
jgi:hypothetical protein